LTTPYYSGNINQWLKVFSRLSFLPETRYS
jgi:hypothetical protein